MTLRGLHSANSQSTGERAMALPLALLFLLALSSRALVLSVQPLDVKVALGSNALVSLLYFGASTASILVGLVQPTLLHRFGRRSVLALGVTLQCLGLVLLSLHFSWSIIAGMFCQVAAVATIEVALSLVLLDNVPRQNLQRFEVFRLFLSGISWTLGPWLGAVLAVSLGSWAPYLAACGFSLSLLVAYSTMPLRQVHTKGKPPSIIAAVPRFFRLPRLRLAWFLAFGRSCWWVMFFVYGPLYLEELGYDKETAGALMSLGLGSVFVVPLWGWLGRRYGLRRLMIWAYGATSAISLLLALWHDPAWFAAATLIFAAYVTVSIDGAGNVPYLRAVKPSQRRDMTPVFLTYRDASQIIPPGIFSLILIWFPLPAIFFAAATWMAGLSVLARYLPRRL